MSQQMKSAVVPAASRKRRIGLRLTTALVCASLALSPAYGQSILAPSNMESLNADRQTAIFASIARYADNLTWTHRIIVEDMRNWDDTSNGADIMAHMQRSDELRVGDFPRLDAYELGRWKVRARLCDDYLIVYYEDDNFKLSITPDEIRQVPIARLTRAGKHQEASGALPLGFIGSDGKLTLSSGGVVDLPASCDANYSTPMPRGMVAVADRAYAWGLSGAPTQHLDGVRWEPCVAPQVGRGTQYRQQMSQSRDLYGNTKGVATPGNWVMTLDACRDPNTSWFQDASQTCAGTFNGQVVQRPVLWEYQRKEIQDPSDPFKTLWIVVDLDGSIVANPRGRLAWHACDDTPTTSQEITTVQGQFTETRTTACQDIYSPTSFTFQPYDRGRYVETRIRTTISQTYDWDREPIEVNHYTPWAVQEDSCHRELLTNHRYSTYSTGCPASFPTGHLAYSRETYDRVHDFAKLGLPREGWTVMQTYFNDTLTDNHCYRTEHRYGTEERREQSCPAGQTGRIIQALNPEMNVHIFQDSNEVNHHVSITHLPASWVTIENSCRVENNDRDEGGIDVDGDGKPDFRNEHDAIHNGYDEWDRTREDCRGACNGPKGDKEQDDDDDGGSGGGGCFLTTAIVERRGEADNGPTLTTLRWFRDEIMAKDPTYAPFIAQYYAIAPEIVAAIPRDHSDWDWIERQVDLCVDLIAAGDMETTFETYRAMVDRLAPRWIDGPLF